MHEAKAEVVVRFASYHTFRNRKETTRYRISGLRYFTPRGDSAPNCYVYVCICVFTLEFYYYSHSKAIRFGLTPVARLKSSGKNDWKLCSGFRRIRTKDG